MLWPFEYLRPTEADELSQILAEHDDAAIMAGGTNLIIDMEHGLRRPDRVVDMKQVGGCDELDWKADGPSFVGAALPVNRLVDCRVMNLDCLRQACLMMATYQVRNRATAAGNLINASPAADLAPPFLVMGTQVLLRKKGSERRVALEDFFTGVGKTVMEAGEWVFGLEIAPRGAQTRSLFYKKQRIKGHDLAIVNMAGLCDPEAKRFRVAIGACATTPLLFDLDAAYAASTSAADVEAELTRAMADRCAPISDVRSSAEYRLDILETFRSRLLAELYA